MVKKILLMISLILISLTTLEALASIPNFPEKNIYFLSPHPDDIPLTFGGLINDHVFAGKNNEVVVFFGFSNYTANGPHNDTSDTRINYVTSARAKEDREALTALFNGWQNFTHVLFNQKESTLRFYEGPKNAGGGASGDFSTFRPIEISAFNTTYQRILPILQQPDCAVFALAAVQSHIDHFIVREALIKAAHDLGDKATCKIYFGEDQPYTGLNKQAADTDLPYLINRLHLQPITYPIDVNKKVNSFKNYYHTQFEEAYIAGITQRAKELDGGERIYEWPKQYYKSAPTDKSCKQDFCKL